MRFTQVRTAEQVDFQALHRIRDRLVRERTGLMNQARAFCIEYGLAMRVGAGAFHADIRRYLGNLENDPTKTMRDLLNDLLDDIAYIENRVKALSARIEAISNEDETIRRLLTIPGIGALAQRHLLRRLAPAANAGIRFRATNGRQFRKARDPDPLRANKSETFDCRKFTLEVAGERSDGNARTSAHGLILPA